MHVIVKRQDQKLCASITCMIRHYVARRAKVIEDHPHNAAIRASTVADHLADDRAVSASPHGGHWHLPCTCPRATLGHVPGDLASMADGRQPPRGVPIQFSFVHTGLLLIRDPPVNDVRQFRTMSDQGSGAARSAGQPITPDESQG